MTGSYRGRRPGKREERLFVNDQIKAPRMLVIGNDGEKLGTFPRQRVVAMSQEQGKDIVQLHYDFEAKVATVRLVDLGKYLYEKQKAAKEKKKSQKKQMKQIKFRYTIGDNDFAFKVKNIRGFLEEGHPVKVSVKLRGREKIFAHKVLERLEAMQTGLADVGRSQDGGTKKEAGTFILILFPRGKA